jgi:hypothetical protein
MNGPHSDETLRRAFGGGDVTRTSTSCRAAERVWAAARGEADAEETGRLLDHVASCESCAAAWAAARAFGPELETRQLTPPTRSASSAKLQTFALAAMIVLVLGLGAWMLRQERRYREHIDALVASSSELERTVAREREARVAAEQLARNLATEVERHSGPLVNLPLFELSADALRSETTARVLEVPASATHVALVLSTTVSIAGGEFSAEAVDASGAVIWRADGLRPSEQAEVFTLAIPRGLMPDGVYRLRLLRAGSSPSLVHEYPLSLVTR